MILQIRKLPISRLIQPAAFDNTVQYCLTGPSINDIIDLDFGMFGQIKPVIKKPQNCWQLIEDAGAYRHVHYALEQPNHRFKIVLTMVYRKDTGKLVTSHVGYEPDTNLADASLHFWQAKQYTFNCVQIDDRKLNEEVYFTAYSNLLEHLKKQNRYELRGMLNLASVDQACMEAQEATKHFSRFTAEWIRDIYQQKFGNPAEAEMNTSALINGVPVTEAFSVKDLESLLTNRADVDTTSASKIEQDLKDQLDRADDFIQLGKNPAHAPDIRNRVITGELVMFVLLNEITYADVEMKSTKDKLYITKGECVNEFTHPEVSHQLYTTTPGDFSALPRNVVQWVYDLLEAMQRFLKCHIEDIREIKTVNFKLLDMILTVTVMLVTGKKKVMVIPILELVNALPVFMWDNTNA